MMKKHQSDFQSPLSESELAQIDLTQYADYPTVLFLHAIVQRGAFWYTAFIHLDNGKVIHSTVNPNKFRREEEARTACQQEHNKMHHLFKLALPDFDIRPVWFH